MAEDIVRLENVSFRYGDITAVRELSISAEQGSLFSLVGPDGAGKTTTIKLICGLIAPDEGEGTVLGMNIRSEYRSIQKQIGYLSQQFSLYEDLSIDENIEFFARSHDVGKYRKRRDELLQFTNLEPFRERLAGNLSGGMKQKLALSCALIHQPDLVLLDEPTTGVDPVSRRDFWGILSELIREGTTVIMATPYLDEAERSDRVALLSEGTVLDESSPGQMRRKLSGDTYEILVERTREAYRTLSESGEFEDIQLFGDRIHARTDREEHDFRTSVEHRLSERRIPLGAIRRIRPGLEDVFIAYVQNERERKS